MRVAPEAVSSEVLFLGVNRTNDLLNIIVQAGEIPRVSTLLETEPVARQGKLSKALNVTLIAWSVDDVEWLHIWPLELGAECQRYHETSWVVFQVH